MKYRKYLNSTINIANLNYNLGLAYFNLTQFNTSKQYFEKTLTVYHEVKQLNRLANVYNYLSILAAKEGKSKNIIYYKKQSDLYFKQYATAKTSKEINELATKYEVEKKERELLQSKADNVTALLELNRQKQLIFYLVGGLIIILLIGFSVFQRNKRKHEFAISHEKERNLQAIIYAEEKERNRIARELHDGIVQQIGTVIINSRNIFSKLGLAEKPESQQMLLQLENSSAELRTISHQMMPRALEEKGFITALKELLENSFSAAKIKYEFEHLNISKHLPKKIEITLYRITQELINNIIKHSAATLVNIQLMKTENTIIFMVEDNGKGFAASRLKNSGIGLKNIKSRINIVKGSINFDSEHTGTLTTIKIPL